jgi:hypothetical protein
VELLGLSGGNRTAGRNQILDCINSHGCASAQTWALSQDCESELIPVSEVKLWFGDSPCCEVVGQSSGRLLPRPEETRQDALCTDRPIGNRSPPACGADSACPDTGHAADRIRRLQQAAAGTSTRTGPRCQSLLAPAGLLVERELRRRYSDRLVRAFASLVCAG